MEIQHKHSYTCNNTIFTLDVNQREITKHGTEEFPCVNYLDKYCNSFYPWHWHDEIELAYVEKGSLTVSINEQRYILIEGEGIFINSGVLHAYSGINNVKCLFPNILFLPSLIYGTKDSVYWKKYMCPFVEAANLSHIIFKREELWQETVLNLVKQAYDLLSLKYFGYELRVRNYLSEILCQIYENCYIRISDRKAKNYSELYRLRKMLDFIQHHYMEPIQIQQIADAVSVSKRECLRCFNHIIGISPKQYTIDLRIQKASELLVETSLSVTEICENCGFSDQSYFTKVFREKVGFSPVKWRKHKQ
ncbi:AraC-type DNA-binding protein [Anaerocolumna jejuensis DSM 15929]|uniref:AraC-type DNA-binding protein n=1 Tax=Anaerocolumna jejuensis DSM 15929 TaxID=1121322 RepID=A0A1M6WB81_9FIRM|nr:AraC family transcriptional regulator [Anaerocolumna jejuensis]SHK91053.1 AraC-type DNA-binding protein [Anaerocolumna jejuensis DSM 15929]